MISIKYTAVGRFWHKAARGNTKRKDPHRPNRWVGVRWALLGLVAVLVSNLALTGLPSVDGGVALAAGTCSNEAVRSEEGAAGLALPDCRAYEMVSPPGSVPARANERVIASVSGQRLGYYTLEPYPGSDEEGLFLLAARGTGGWSVQNVIPRQGGLHDSDYIACFPSVFYSEELNYAVLSDGWEQFGEGREQVCEGDDPPLVAGEPRGYANLFLRNNEDGSYQLLDRPLEGSAPADALMLAGSSDLSHVVFADAAQLTPQTPAGTNLYEWVQGSDHLVTFLPGGEPVQGVLANVASGSAPFTHAVSASGETVFFYADGGLYARLHATHEPRSNGACDAGEPEHACTVQIDAAAAGGVDAGGGVFVYASEDGSRAFFTDEHRLTSNATAEANSPDLYEYDLQTGVLTDLTVASSGSANVLGFSGASANGAYLYFVAKSVLSGGQANSYGEIAEPYKPNLYLRHDGITTFIATLEAGQKGDQTDWQEYGTQHNTGMFTVRVSSNGSYLAFDSVRPIDPEYDNEPFESQDCSAGRCAEIYLYEAAENKLSCASCTPDGELPTAEAKIPYPATELLTPESPAYAQRSVSDGGYVFFDTRTALVPQATNGEVNVYEYEHGVVSLISSGTAAGASEFLNASVSGDDVFFSTGQGLVQADTDNMGSVYDARVGGGFPAGASETEQVGTCENEEACKPPPSEAPAQLPSASAALSGGGNLTAPPVPVTPAPEKGSVVKRSLTRAQKLAQALRGCAKRPKHSRPRCRALAHGRFGAKPTKHVRPSGLRRRLGEPSASERRPGR